MIALKKLEYTEPKARSRTPVLSLHTSPEVKIVVLTPVGFDEVEKISNQLKSRKTVVVNLSKTTKEVSQRILDFWEALFLLSMEVCRG